jgi:hypothetical protein
MGRKEPIRHLRRGCVPDNGPEFVATAGVRGGAVTGRRVGVGLPDGVGLPVEGFGEAGVGEEFGFGEPEVDLVLCLAWVA